MCIRDRDVGAFARDVEQRLDQLEERHRRVAADGEVFNLGGDAPVSLLELVKTLLDIAGKGSYVLTPFPPERKRIDIGDFYADTTKIRNTLGWTPRVPLREGLERTIDYYRRHRDRYL